MQIWLRSFKRKIVDWLIKINTWNLDNLVLQSVQFLPNFIGSLIKKIKCMNNIKAQFFMQLQSFFAERFFDLFDKEKSGNIEVYLLLHGLRTLANGAPVEKLKFVFDVYDIDGKCCYKTDLKPWYP